MDYNKYDCRDLREFVFADALFNNVDIEPVCNLFHYTTSDNYEKIVKPDIIKLRLSRISTFKDECEQIFASFYTVCQKCLSENIIDQNFYNTILTAAKEGKCHLDEYKKLYIVCFSKNENNQYLIDNYASKGGKEGLVIGFHFLNLEELTYDDNNSSKDTGIHIFDVVYDNQKQREDLEQFIRTIYRLKEQDTYDGKLIRAAVINRLLLHCAVYKNEVFTPEQETRIIVDFDKAKDNPIIDICEEDNNYMYINMNKEASLYFIKHLKENVEIVTL